MRIQLLRWLYVILCAVALSSFSLHGYLLSTQHAKQADRKESKRSDYEPKIVAVSLKRQRGRGSFGGNIYEHPHHNKSASTPLLKRSPFLIVISTSILLFSLIW